MCGRITWYAQITSVCPRRFWGKFNTASFCVQVPVWVRVHLVAAIASWSGILTFHLEMGHLHAPLVALANTISIGFPISVNFIALHSVTGEHMPVFHFSLWHRIHYPSGYFPKGETMPVTFQMFLVLFNFTFLIFFLPKAASQVWAIAQGRKSRRLLISGLMENHQAVHQCSRVCL